MNIASKYVDLTFSEHTESPKHECPGKRILNIGVLVNLGVDYKPFQAVYCAKRICLVCGNIRFTQIHVLCWCPFYVQTLSLILVNSHGASVFWKQWCKNVKYALVR